MRKLRCRSGLRAFSLIELVVAIGVLALMMALAGKVFTLSIQSTNQANALMEVSQSFRLLEESLQEDLGGVSRDRSMLIIKANPINAYWTEDQRDNDEALDPSKDPGNGYPHSGDPERERVDLGINGAPTPPFALESPRADVLMLFTSREADSTVHPRIKSDLAQVVYGHAQIGDLDAKGVWMVDPAPFPGDDAGAPAPGAIFGEGVNAMPDRFLARNWHLARRSVVLVDAPKNRLPGLSAAEVEMIPESPDEGDDFLLRDGKLDLIAAARQTGHDSPPKLFFDADVLEGTPWTNPSLYTWYQRSRLDPVPPASEASRLSHYFLPHCASFKVEWALTHPELDSILSRMSDRDRPREILWVDPANVSGPGSVGKRITDLVEAMRTDSDGGNDGLADELETFYEDTFGDASLEGTADVRFSIDPGDAGTAVHAFYAHDPSNSTGLAEPDPFFPKALRVTVDMYDDTSRLTRPIRHVLVIPLDG